MDWSVIAKSGIDQLTQPRSAGKVVNPHVVRHTAAPKPDYGKMRDLAHTSGKDSEKRAANESAPE